MALDAFTYVGLFAVAAGFGLFLTPMALRLALRRGVLDHPRDHKSHSQPVPYLGGAAIVVSFSAAVLAAALIRPPPSRLGEFVAILATAVVLSLVGLADDLRNLSPWVRLSLQVAAGFVVVAVGAGVSLFQSDALNALFTVAWIVGVTNAFNLLDNMDGLSAGVALIAAVSFFVIAAFNGQYLVAALAIALAGCASAFLRHNFHPARIYMGDAGALFLGFLLAVIGLKLRFPGPTQVTFFVPIAVLGVAILDTALVTTTRLLHGRNPLSGGRDHLSHRLVFVGIPIPAAVTLIYGAALAHGWVGLILSRVDRGSGLLLMGLVVAVDLTLGTLLAMVPVYDTSHRRRYMLREVADREPQPSAATTASGQQRDGSI